MDSANKEKELDQREKITATNIIRTGHFYLGKKRTFLNWFDKKIKILLHQNDNVLFSQSRNVLF